jgi:methionyl-tRNA formyltransferase
MGTPLFAIPSLEAIYNSHHNILAVVTAPDKPKGRGQIISESEVKKFAAEKKILTLQPENLKDIKFQKQLKSFNPDLIAVVAFRILPDAVIKIPKYGSINLHASLLPKYRGAAPINWAIINGEKHTGVTVFFIQQNVDTGNIIMQKSIDIANDDNAGTLHNKLMYLGANVLLDSINLIEKFGNNVNVIKQNESDATPAPKIFKNDCKINFNQDIDKVYNFIRGLTPYPGAFTEYNGKILKIFGAVKSKWDSIKGPGRFFIKEGKLYVSCLNEFLEITELQFEGKRKMSAEEFINGYGYMFPKFNQ